MNIINRNDAKLLGLNKFFTGVPCKNGHISERYVQSGSCQQCVNGERNVTQSHNLKEKAQSLRDKSNLLSITSTKNYAAAIAEAERVYNLTSRNAAELLRQAEEIERKQAEVSEYLTVTEDEKQRKASELRRKRDAQSQLISVYVMIKAGDKEAVEAALLPMLQARCDLLTIDDLRHRNKCQGGLRWEFKCHPEDFKEVVRITDEIYNGKSVPKPPLPPAPASQVGNSTEFNEHLYSPMS
jgi:hypothetical protein